MSGQLTYHLSGSQSQTINICESLDWKRQFGIHLWYHSLPIHNISDALSAYEQSVSVENCSKPVPPYIEDSVSNSQDTSNAIVPSGLNNATSEQKQTTTSPNSSSLYDTCYHLIKLYCNSSHPIEHIISPLNHSGNQLDFRLRFFFFNWIFCYLI
jgi:nuclear pore complex protein Nup98-Nup96